jgi:hypothetical protein
MFLNALVVNSLQVDDYESDLLVISRPAIAKTSVKSLLLNVIPLPCSQQMTYLARVLPLSTSLKIYRSIRPRPRSPHQHAMCDIAPCASATWQYNSRDDVEVDSSSFPRVWLSSRQLAATSDQSPFGRAPRNGTLVRGRVEGGDPL